VGVRGQLRGARFGNNQAVHSWLPGAHTLGFPCPQPWLATSSGLQSEDGPMGRGEEELDYIHAVSRGLRGGVGGPAFRAQTPPSKISPDGPFSHDPPRKLRPPHRCTFAALVWIAFRKN
jgi:hypothetical protein